MPAKLVEVGRLELRGAQARFKQKGTLEASDRNLAALVKVLVRVTPSPELKLFADFIFADEIFRVFQEATLINYKEFLEKPEFSGIDNFRALIRYATRALPGGDTSTREFYEQRKPPERFLSKEEMDAYQEAVVSGAQPASRDPQAPLSTVPDAEKKAIADREWKKFAVDLAQAKAERPQTSLFTGGLLTIVGLAILAASMASLHSASLIPAGAVGPNGGPAPNVYPLIALGAIAGIALTLAGVLYLRKKDVS